MFKTGFTMAVALVLSAGCLPGGTDDAVDLDTIEPGVIMVAVQTYPPYTDLERGKLTGLDSDILTVIATRLGFEIRTEVVDFATMIAGVQAGRFDMAIGGVAWTPDRELGGLFTDPPYYSPPALAVGAGKDYADVKDLEGRRLATVEGYVWAEAIDAVPRAELVTYQDAKGVLDDIGKGRIDGGFLDPLLIIAAEREQPELGIATRYLAPPSAAQVAKAPSYKYFQPYMTSFYISRQSDPLEEAVSREIQAMYASGELRALIEKWGGDPEQFLKPSPEMAAQRRGVDRPLDWAPPSI